MMKHGLRAALAAGVLMASMGAAHAVLRNEKDINDGLVILAAGNMIQDKCDDITPRMLRAYNFARRLQRMALDRGYSDDEIEVFVEDKAEKKRVEDAANAYLLSKGLDPGVPESYCTVGRYEIDRNSQIGVMLKMR